ncbi:beta-propeller fold lactonase family protein [Acidipila sp. EB88]|uniref:lactonase family protein n=1 Tax=Acidipila sp. EB88 TaxID=2305226 RepID=UPI000F6003AC|nr:beta-propeller fold lactonase family protein [Acidipila sp. EB88]RRA47564.1 hypothetical protein D1Y84_03875 [Acidipila sp. EB88]
MARKQQRARWTRRSAWIACLAVLLMVGISGCGSGFFSPSSSGTGSSTGTGSGSSTRNAVYVANSNPNLDTVASFSLSAGVLTALTGSPAQVPTVPSALAINPAGDLLWVGGELGEIYVYTTDAVGALTLGASSDPVGEVDGTVGSMVVDPTGQWLLVEVNTGTTPVIYVFQIDSSTGTLTQTTGSPVVLDTGSATQLAFTPGGTELFAALGTGGVDVLTFTPSSGALGKLNVLLNPLGSSYSDQGLAVDTTGTYLFVAETGTNGLRVLTINSGGSLSEVAGSPFAAGLGPKSVVVDATNAYVYVSNAATNTISGYALASATGALTPLAGSPFTTGSGPYSLTEDGTGTYLLAASEGGNPDLQVFTITASTGTVPGALVSATTASTGSTSSVAAAAIAVAATP